MIDLQTCEILPRLPDYLRPEIGEIVPADLVGAKIVAIGTPTVAGAVEGGGLVIDYELPSGQVKRIVLAFNECGMWVNTQNKEGA